MLLLVVQFCSFRNHAKSDTIFFSHTALFSLGRKVAYQLYSFPQVAQISIHISSQFKRTVLFFSLRLPQQGLVWDVRAVLCALRRPLPLLQHASLFARVLVPAAPLPRARAHTRTRARAHVCPRACARLRASVCARPRVRACALARAHVRTHASARARVHAQTRMHARSRVRACARVRARARWRAQCAHAHARSLA